MPKNSVPDWNQTANNNQDVGGISIGEGMSAANVNDALREIMAQIAGWVGSDRWRDEAAITTNGSLNSILKSGIYQWTGASDNGTPLQTGNGVVLHLNRLAPTETQPQRAIQIAGTAGFNRVARIFWREFTNNGWSGWREFLTAQMTAAGLFQVTDAAVTVGTAGGAIIDFTQPIYGVSIAPSGGIAVARENNTPFRMKRGNSGQLMQIAVGTTDVASVDVSGGVVTWGSFCGSHWSQFHSFAMPDIPRGTIVETIDEMCVWADPEGIGRSDDVLPRIKIATEGSTCVYGVFSHWDTDDPINTRDAVIAALGVNLIRLAPGITPVKGMLVQSGPDGMGVPQIGDAFTTRTVGKLLTSLITDTLPDGSILVPCSLHCG